MVWSFTPDWVVSVLPYGSISSILVSSSVDRASCSLLAMAPWDKPVRPPWVTTAILDSLHNSKLNSYALIYIFSILKDSEYLSETLKTVDQYLLIKDLRLINSPIFTDYRKDGRYQILINSLQTIVIY